MKDERRKVRAANPILPFALFGLLAPIATYLIAVSNLSTNGKTWILSLLAGLYVLLFAISLKRLRSSVIEQSRISQQESNARDPKVTGSGADGHPYRDALTGLANEWGFRLVLERELAESLRNPDDRPLSVLTIELPDLEAVSSSYGPSARDGLLKHAADAIKKNLRAMDLAARLSDGEFAVIMPTANESGAIEISRRIENEFANGPIEVADGESITISVFIGAATFPPDGDTAESLVGNAMTRKRAAKASENRLEDAKVNEYVN